MSLYVEIMCDKRCEGTDPTDQYGLRHLCWSDRGDDPNGYSVATAKQQARLQGWKLARGNEATCPGCLTVQP